MGKIGTVPTTAPKGVNLKDHTTPRQDQNKKRIGWFSPLEEILEANPAFVVWSKKTSHLIKTKLKKSFCWH